MADDLDLDEALAATLARVPEAELRTATARLIETYRSGAPPTSRAVATPADAAAYAAYRMPATHAAVRRALGDVTRGLPGFAPTTLLDVGGGTGAATWAAAVTWPSLRAATVLDGAPEALALGRQVGAHGTGVLRATTWTRFELPGALPRADVGTLGYVLGELAPEVADATVRALVAAVQVAVVVEPGTPRGYAAVLAARSTLLEAGWRLVGPCPHALACPLRDGDWCHSSVRVARSALHRRVKGGALSWEDEKYSWVAAVAPGAELAVVGDGDGGGGLAGQPGWSRVLRHPVRRKGLVQLEFCRPDGSAGREVVTRRDGAAYRIARDLDWGDRWDPTRF